MIFFTYSAVAESYITEMPTMAGFRFNYKYSGQDIIYDENNFQAHERRLEAPPMPAQQLRLMEIHGKIVAGILKNPGTKRILSFLFTRAYLENHPEYDPSRHPPGGWEAVMNQDAHVNAALWGVILIFNLVERVGSLLTPPQGTVGVA